MTLEDALEQALRENGLDPSFEGDVRELLATPRERWPACCGGLCDPCVLALHRAADRVRRLCPDAPAPAE